MDYNETSIHEYLKVTVGDKDYVRFAPKLDRLVTLYLEYNTIRNWLDKNKDIVGSKDYKEYVTVMNALMQNIRNLEDDVELFKERKIEVENNPLLKAFKVWFIIKFMTNSCSYAG